jgi:hypothetical protein
MGATTLVWYAAYGSNLDADRFACYLRGGTPRGSTVANPGARDPSPPRERRALFLPGRVYFARWAERWGGGGVAFYDPEAEGPAAARAYLVTTDQFDDVAAQEGPWYARHLDLGELEGRPLRSFTAAWGRADVVATAPHEPYLRTVACGLVDAHGWTPEEAAAYLCGLDGCAGAWDPADVAALLAE